MNMRRIENRGPFCEMSKPRPPYLQRQINRHGSVVWYVRKRPNGRIRIRGDYGSPAFMAAYHKAVSSDYRPTKAKKISENKQSLEWLIDAYRKSASWQELSQATKKQRENIFLHTLSSAGDIPFASIKRSDIRAGIDKRASTPAQANNFLKAMRGLFKWDLDAEHVQADPTINIKGVRIKSQGFHVWTEEEILKFENRWPIGTRERLALAILLYTGLRRGDAAKLGPQHVKNGVILMETEKTGTPIAIPILPQLQEIIDQSPVGRVTLIARHDGLPMVKEGFGNWFSDASRVAGVPGSCHGLRKAGATRAAESGATEHELNAIFGWTGNKMASLYTKTANRARLAERAMEKLSREQKRISMPSPSQDLPSPKNFYKENNSLIGIGAQERTRTSTAFTTGT